jgi:hypothetical protein
LDTLTLDTKVPQEYWRDQAKKDVVEKLRVLADAGDVSLVVTARIGEDMPEGLPENSQTFPGFLWKRLLPSRVWITGYSGGIAATQEIEAELKRLGGRKLPDWRDWDHLHAHMLLGRDFFSLGTNRCSRLVSCCVSGLDSACVRPRRTSPCRAVPLRALGGRVLWRTQETGAARIPVLDRSAA